MTIIDIPLLITNTNNILNPSKGSEGTQNASTERKPWNSKIEFILSSVGFAVGLGNIWRFPYIAYNYGGGSFLLPYMLMIFIVGFPAFFLEFAIGQWSGQGPTRVYGRLAPALKGIGFGMVAAAFLLGMYYNVIVGWALFYLFKGFNSELPWSTCANGSPHCYEGLINDSIKSVDPYAVNPSEDFFNHALLGLDKAEHNWSNLGEMHWSMVACLAGAWILVCVSSIRGVQSIGKVAYFTALFPYFMMTVLLVYGMVYDYEGSKIGILGYVTPDWEKVQDLSVWKEAAIQIVFSLGLGNGVPGTSASYNQFNNNCLHDAIAVVLINCATSVFAGFVVFSYLGIMAHHQGFTDVKDAVEGGIGLVFKVYPELLTKLGAWPIPQILSFLLFVMVIALGLGSMFGFLETVTTSMVDHLQSSKYKASCFSKKPTIVITTCALSFILGLGMCTKGGYFMFDLLDRNVVGWNCLLLIMLEVILISWLYGVENFLINVKEMKINPSKIMQIYLKTTWCIITPLVLLVLVISSLNSQSTQVTHMYLRPGNADWVYSLTNVENISFHNSTFYQDGKVIKSTIVGSYQINGSTWKIEGDDKMTSSSYVWPNNIQVLGWLISSFPILLLIIVAFYQVCKRKYEGRHEWKGIALFQPTEHWKPNVNEISAVEEELLNDKSNTPIIKRQASIEGS